MLNTCSPATCPVITFDTCSRSRPLRMPTKSSRPAIDTSGAGIEPAAGEQRALAPEDRHGGHLRIAAAHGAQLVVNLGFARADAVVVETLGQIDDARVERLVHVEHFQRVFFRDAHGAQRHVGGIGFARAQIAERHGGHVHARQHDGCDQQGDQRDAPHVEILFRHGRKRRLLLRGRRKDGSRAAGRTGLVSLLIRPGVVRDRNAGSRLHTRSIALEHSAEVTATNARCRAQDYSSDFINSDKSRSANEHKSDKCKMNDSQFSIKRF